MYITFFSALSIDLALSLSGALQVGDAAPEFKAMATNDKEINLSDLKGRWVVLYFYPKAFTPGCTAEACALRDSYGDIKKLGVMIGDESLDKPKIDESGTVILGVSTDKVETQKKFKAKYNLPFELLDDSNKKVSKAYEVLGLTGTAQRKTFIIDPAGKIAYIFEKVKSSEHDREVKEVLAELQQKKG